MKKYEAVIKLEIVAENISLAMDRAYHHLPSPGCSEVWLRGAHIDSVSEVHELEVLSENQSGG